MCGRMSNKGIFSNPLGLPLSSSAMFTCCLQVNKFSPSAEKMPGRLTGHNAKTFPLCTSFAFPLEKLSEPERTHSRTHSHKYRWARSEALNDFARNGKGVQGNGCPTGTHPPDIDYLLFFIISLHMACFLLNYT